MMIPRLKIIDAARRVYSSFGFAPIDTPALEYLDILLGKGSEESDKQMYSFTDHGGREVGMRFDLTIPLARFAAQHIGQLGTPFKRYHIASVWRGENTQRGRYREFMQCDFDTIGTKSVAADIEMVLVIDRLMQEIGIDDFTIRINNRQVLSGLLQTLGLADKSAEILRAIDKLSKIGREGVVKELTGQGGLSADQADRVLQLVGIEATDNATVLAELEKIVAGNETGEAGVARLAEILSGAAAAGVGDGRVVLDVSIARGLDYYTGVVFETFLDQLPAIGSVASGGRYDNLAELYTKQELPGIGGSLGLDRLLAAMEELKMLDGRATTAPVLVAYFDADRLPDYLKIAQSVRAAGIGAELYPEPKKLGQQLKYADRRGFQIALIAGTNELERGVCQVKDLAGRTTEDVALAELPEAVKRLLEGVSK